MAEARTYGAAYNRLEIDGTDVGPLHSVEGGDPFGKVLQVAGTTDKQIAGVQFSDIVLECGLSPSGPLGAWIRDTLARSFVRHDGAIVEFGSDYKETSRLRFQQALIREIEFPALDASSRDPSYLTVSVAPESTQRQAGSGASGAKDLGVSKSAKQPRSCDFRLQIDGLDTKRVTQVAPLVVRQVAPQDAVGDAREIYTEPPKIEIGDLVVTLAEAADWYAWRDAFLLTGTGTERSGSLEYLSPNLKDVVGRIEFSGLGIHSLVREQSGEDVPALRRVRASMYCESLNFALGAAPAQAVAVTNGASTTSSRPSRVDVAVPLASDRVLASSRMRLL